MIKIQCFGNLWVKCLKKIIILGFLYIALVNNAIAISDLDIRLNNDIKSLLKKEGILFDKFNDDLQISYELPKNSYINWQDIESFNIKIVNVNKKNRHFTACIEGISSSLGKIEIPISGQYDEYIVVPVLKSPMRSGELIRSHNIDTIRINVSKLKADTILSNNLLLNKTPRNSVAAYQALSEKQLVAPKIINKNDTVIAFYERANLTLKLEVIALDAGAIGELIKVKNKRSGTILNAIVEERDKVRVR